MNAGSKAASAPGHAPAREQPAEPGTDPAPLLSNKTTPGLGLGSQCKADPDVQE